MPRVNFQMKALASAARTATVAVVMPANKRHTGVVAVLDVTAASGTGGLTVKIRGMDSVSGKYIDLLSDPTPIVATGTYGFELNPSEGTASGGVRVATSRHLPKQWQVEVVHGDGSSYTYSLGVTLFV